MLYSVVVTIFYRGKSVSSLLMKSACVLLCASNVCRGTVGDVVLGPVESASKAVVGPFSAFYADADQEYQELLQEAYDAFNVPAERRILAKKFSAAIDPYGCSLYVNNGHSVVFIDQDKLNNLPYGVRRFSLFRAGCHVSHRDAAKKTIFDVAQCAAFMGSFYLTSPVGQKLTGHEFRFTSGNRLKWILLWYAVDVVSQLPLAVSQFCMRSINERRSDRQAAGACACKKCIEEAADARAQYFNEHPTLFYLGLSPDDLRTIAQETKTLCAHHQQEDVGLFESGHQAD